MKTSNSNSKAHTLLGVVALITATTLALFLAGCNQTGTGKGTVTPPATKKHKVTFSVEGTPANGTLKAKADGTPETDKSPINVEEGKVVTFTATHNAGYKVKEWKLDGNVVPNNKTNTYTHTVAKKDANITVSFESEGATSKHAVNFSVEGENGTLKAKADGITETDKSPINVEEGKVVTFTATPNDGYRVKEWKADNTVVDNNETNKTNPIVTEAAKIK